MTRTRHRSFSFTTEDVEPVTFDVNGEEFNCVATLPAGVLLDTATNLLGNGAVNPAAIGEFFDAVVVPEDRERFAKLLRSEGGPRLDTLIQITTFLVEEYTDFPTQKSSGSSAEHTLTAAGFKENSHLQRSGSKNSQHRKR